MRKEVIRNSRGQVCEVIMSRPSSFPQKHDVLVKNLSDQTIEKYIGFDKNRSSAFARRTYGKVSDEKLFFIKQEFKYR